MQAVSLINENTGTLAMDIIGNFMKRIERVNMNNDRVYAIIKGDIRDLKFLLKTIDNDMKKRNIESIRATYNLLEKKMEILKELISGLE